MRLFQVTSILNLVLLVAAARVQGTGGTGNLYSGNWQAKFSRLHSSILRGEATSRFAVSIAVESGFANNVVGLISEFYLHYLVTGPSRLPPTIPFHCTVQLSIRPILIGLGS